jgi:hypothetical protein
MIINNSVGYCIGVSVQPIFCCLGVAPAIKENATSGCLVLSCVSIEQA